MIDPNEAPDGFVAVESPKDGWACRKCAFVKDTERCLDSDCYAGSRKDLTSVIFIPREKSNLAEFSAIGELVEARARIKEIEGINHGLTFQNDGLKRKIAAQRERIRYLEGATNHATGTPLSKAKDEAVNWKLAHDQVCKKFADCENARDENAEMYETEKADHGITRFGLVKTTEELIQAKAEIQKAKDEAARWKAACLERDELIAKLKAQLTMALDAIARMR